MTFFALDRRDLLDEYDRLLSWMSYRFLVHTSYIRELAHREKTFAQEIRNIANIGLQLGLSEAAIAEDIDVNLPRSFRTEIVSHEFLVRRRTVKVFNVRLTRGLDENETYIVFDIALGPHVHHDCREYWPIPRQHAEYGISWLYQDNALGLGEDEIDYVHAELCAYKLNSLPVFGTNAIVTEQAQVILASTKDVKRMLLSATELNTLHENSPYPFELKGLGHGLADATKCVTLMPDLSSQIFCLCWTECVGEGAIIEGPEHLANDQLYCELISWRDQLLDTTDLDEQDYILSGIFLVMHQTRVIKRLRPLRGRYGRAAHPGLQLTFQTCVSGDS